MTCRWHAFQKLHWTVAESSVGQLLSVAFRFWIVTRLYQEELNLWVKLDGSKLFTMINFESNLIRSNLIMANTAKTRSVTAHVPEQLAQKVDLMAERLERSKNWIVKQALTAWIDQEEERSRLTREALADVDAGRVIDHQAVQAWADSLSTDTPLPVPR